jgi:hypothetical protein
MLKYNVKARDAVTKLRCTLSIERPIEDKVIAFLRQ